MTARTTEPPDGTILAAEDLTEAWMRDDETATKSSYGRACWYPMGNEIDGPEPWEGLPDHIRNGVRLVVAEEPEPVPGRREAAILRWAASKMRDECKHPEEVARLCSARARDLDNWAAQIETMRANEVQRLRDVLPTEED